MCANATNQINTPLGKVFNFDVLNKIYEEIIIIAFLKLILIFSDANICNFKFAAKYLCSL
jgi:hypothetical protein